MGVTRASDSEPLTIRSCCLHFGIDKTGDTRYRGGALRFFHHTPDLRGSILFLRYIETYEDI